VEGKFGKLINKKALYVTPGNPVFKLPGPWLPYIPYGEGYSVPFLAQEKKEKNFRYLTGSTIRGMTGGVTHNGENSC